MRHLLPSDPLQQGCAIAGLVVLGGIWLGPLPGMAHGSFSAHMLMHMGVVAVAAPLLALGFAGTRADPVRRWPALLPPIPVSLVELAVVWIWHAPAFHRLARHSSAGLVAEQFTFLVAGLAIWLAAFGGGTAVRHIRAGAGVAALLLTSMHMTLLGALLALTPRTLYHHMPDDGALTPLQDQHLGGAIMLLIGGVAYLAGGLWLAAGLLKSVSTKRRISP